MDIIIRNKENLPIDLASYLATRFLDGLEIEALHHIHSEFELKDGRVIVADGRINKKSISVELALKED